MDCTAALNLKHVHDKDSAWLTPFPTEVQPCPAHYKSLMLYHRLVKSLSSVQRDQMLEWSSVQVYPGESTAETKPKLAIVSYGNGVPLSLQAAKLLSDEVQVSTTLI